MNKKSGFLVLALVIIFGCYAALLSLIAPVIGVTYAVTMVFSVIAVLLAAAIIMMFLPKSSIEGYFYQAPAIRSGIVYIIVQFIVGFILTMVILNLRIVLIVELIVLGVFGGKTAYAAFGGLHAKDVNDKHKESVSNMKRLAAEAKSIMDGTTDYEWKRLVKGVWEEINYAPPVTTEATERIENDINFELGLLRVAVAEKNRQEFDESAKRIESLLAARKQI